jgi:hypothetical protein
MRGLKQQEAALKLQMLTNKDKRAEVMLGPQLAQIQAKIAHLNRPSTAGILKPKNQYDTARGFIVDVNSGKTSQVIGPDGEPVKKAPTAEAQNKIALLSAMQSSLARLKELSNTKEGKAAIGYFGGKAIGATRGMMNYPPEVQDMFNISDTLANDYMNAKSGAAISPKEAVRLEKVLPRPSTDRSKFDSDVRRFEIELANAIAARKGEELSQGESVSPGTPAAPSRPKTNSPKTKIGRFTVEVVN